MHADVALTFPLNDMLKVLRDTLTYPAHMRVTHSFANTQHPNARLFDTIAVMHADVASTFPLNDMLKFHRDTQALVGHSITTVMGCQVCVWTSV